MKIEEEVKILRKAYELLAEGYHNHVCSECCCVSCTGCFFRKEKLELRFIEKAIVAIDESGEKNTEELDDEND